MLDLPLTPHSRTILERAIAEESGKRKHLVIALTGAHAYGFPSPDSDFDLKAIHVEATARLLGLSTPAAHFDRMEVIEGVEIDYTSNELKPVLHGVLHGNGNYIERILGKYAPLTSPLHDSLKPLVQASLSRRLAGHYLGFSTSQLGMFVRETTAKKLLYVLRTALTGLHALRAGQVEPNLAALIETYGFASVAELIEVKLRGEKVKLSGDEAAHWKVEAERAMGLLRAAVETSVLPPEPPEAAANNLEAWLLEVRQQGT